MPTLKDRLADLADQAPTTGPDPRLADRARRYHRRRRAGTAVVLAAVLGALSGLGGLTWQRAEPTVVASSGARAALPDQLHVPSPWLPSTAEDGPLGRLAAVLPVDAGDRQRVVGVAATSGEYRYLSLPDYVTGPVALAPDGRSVAYPLARVAEDTDGRLVISVGVGVYDPVTETVRRYEPRGSLGVGADKLLWADEQTLVWNQYRVTGSPRDPTSVGGPLMLWDTEESEPRAFPAALRQARASAAGNGSLVLGGETGNRVRVVTVDDLTSWRRVRIQGPLHPVDPDVVVDGALSRIAVTRASPDADGGPAKTLLTAALPAVETGGGTGGGNAGPIRVSPEPVAGSEQTEGLIGWTGPREIATTRQRSSGTTVYGPRRLVVVDVETGESRQVTTIPEEVYFPSLAADLFSVESVTRPEPPRPLDPRAVAVLGVGAVLVGAGALWWWRRRVRP